MDGLRPDRIWTHCTGEDGETLSVLIDALRVGETVWAAHLWLDEKTNRPRPDIGWTVTHIPTGRTVCSVPLKRDEAARFLMALAAEAGDFALDRDLGQDVCPVPEQVEAILSRFHLSAPRRRR